MGMLLLASLVVVALGLNCSDESNAEPVGTLTEVGGVTYTLDEIGNSYTAVASWDGTSSEIVIKSSVNYNEKTYSVTRVNQFGTNSVVTSVMIESNPSLVFADGTFKNNYELSSIILGGGIQQLPIDFCLGTKITSVTIPSTVTEIGTGCFASCNSLTTVSLPPGVNTIPATAFSGCKALTTINLGNIQSFGDSSFENCELLNPVDLSSATLIGNAVFKNCNAIVGVVLPECLEDVGDEIFSNCQGIKSVTVSSTPINFGMQMFYNCDNLTEIMLTDNAKVVGRQMFSDCNNIETIDLNKVEIIGMSAFRGSANLKNVVNSVNIKTIDVTAFQNCTSLKNFIFGDRLTYLGIGAFDNTIMESVDIPANLTIIPWSGSNGDVFLFPFTVASITISPDNPEFTVMGGIVYKKDMSAAVYCPPAMTGEATIYANVADFACYGCHLTKVIIADGATSIGKAAFVVNGTDGYLKSTLTEITIPDSVENIGAYAFSMQLSSTLKYESSLVALELPANLKTLGTGVLSLHPDLQYIVFPDGDFTPSSTSGLKYYSTDGKTQLNTSKLWKKDTPVTTFHGLRFVLNPTNNRLCQISDDQVLLTTCVGEKKAYLAVSKDSECSIEEPVAPNHMVFKGWFKDSGFTVQFDAAVALGADIVLYALFSPETHTVTYRLDGEDVAVETYEYGTNVALRAVPDKIGYTVTAWASERVDPVDGFFTIGEADVVFAATSIVNQYTITFDTAGGSAIAAITQDYNTSVTAPSAEPTKGGYRFVKWDSEIPASMPANDVIIKAVWAIVATVNENGKSIVTLDSETSSFIPAAETKEITVEIRENMAVKVENASDLVGKTVVSKVEPISNSTGVSGTAYEFTLTADGTQYNGKIQVTLPYTKEAGKEPVVYYWNGSESTKMNVVSSTETSVTFETEHNSTYVVASETPSKDDGASFLLYFGILMIAGICVSMLVGFNFYRKKA